MERRATPSKPETNGVGLSRRDLLKAAAGMAVGATAIAARPSSAAMRWDDQADVIVVGLGAAGASAAIEARDLGASVLVLERAEAGGGTSALAGGIIYYGGGTPLQRALGFEDSPEEMYKYLIAASGPAPDEEKLKLYCEQSVEHYGWTLGCGVPFKPSFYEGLSLPLTDDGLSYSGSENAHPFNALAKPAPRGHKPMVPGDGGGALLMEKLVARVAAEEARVQYRVLCSTLIQKADGRVAGVTAYADGVERNYLAHRAVVLAAGGFCKNPEMIRRYAPIYLSCDSPIGVAGDDGRAVRMGMGAGGDVMRMDSAFCAMPFHPPEKLIEGILVNSQGQRFINEDRYYGDTGNAIVREQGGRAFLIVDREASVESAYGRPRLFAEGATPAELERAMGLPEPVLQNTLAVYNRYAAQGKDPLLRKAPRFLRPLDKPPLRVFDCSTSVAYYPYFTLGGLRTRSSGEVLDVEGRPVAGLFAAGRTTSGLSGLGYSSGIALADATFFGRLAGRSAARTDHL